MLMAVQDHLNTGHARRHFEANVHAVVAQHLAFTNAKRPVGS